MVSPDNEKYCLIYSFVALWYLFLSSVQIDRPSLNGICFLFVDIVDRTNAEFRLNEKR